MPKSIDITKNFKSGSTLIVQRNAETMMNDELCRYSAARAMYISSLFFYKTNFIGLMQAVNHITDDAMRDNLRQFLNDNFNQCWAFNRSFQRAYGVDLIERVS